MQVYGVDMLVLSFTACVKTAVVVAITPIQKCYIYIVHMLFWPVLDNMNLAPPAQMI